MDFGSFGPGGRSEKPCDHPKQKIDSFIVINTPALRTGQLLEQAF
jgi:hypothetical protein